ncbi:MAG: hypothetical protein AAF628_32660 [Planctomycetota bacterium]
MDHPSAASTRVAVALVALGIASTAPAPRAQYTGEPPIVLRESTIPASVFGPTVTQISQIELTRIPGSRLLYASMTVQRSSSPGNWDPMTGTLDLRPDPPVFVELDHVAAFATPAIEWSLTISDDRLVAAFERNLGTFAGFSARATPDDPFPAPVRLRAVGPFTRLRDVKLWREGGAEQLAVLAQSGDFVTYDFDRTAFTSGLPALANPRTLISAPAGNTLSGVDLLTTPAGDGSAALCSLSLDGGLTSAAAYVSGVADQEAPKTFLDRGTFLGNPGSNGGTTLWPELIGSSFPHLVRLDIVATNSQILPAGAPSTLQTCVWGGCYDEIAVWVALPVYSVLGSVGLPVPGLMGALGLNPAVLLAPFPPLPIQPEFGLAAYQVPLPPIAAGIEFHSQAVLLEPSGQLFLGNTGTYEVR